MNSKWNTIPDDSVIEKTAAAVKARGTEVIIVATKEEALTKLKELLPNDAEIATGSSTTLHEIGFMDYLGSDDNNYKNLLAIAHQEPDAEKRSDLRRKADTAEYFLGSVNAISQNGELVAVDNTGSRTSAYLFAAKHVILVASVQKIAENLEEAMNRVREYVLPLEKDRAMKAYGINSSTNKWAIIEGEVNPARMKLILVKESLGF